MGAYRALLARTDARVLAGAAAVSRIATPVLSLCLLLATRAATGSYSKGSLVLAGYAFALALLQPVSGRLADRAGLRMVLLCCLAVHACGYAALITALTVRAPVLVLIACAVILGASMPPLGPAIRGSWAAVVPEELLKTAYALDAVINESAVIVGPLLVTALITVVPARFVMLIAGLGVASGILVLVRTRARRNAPELHLGAPRRTLRGPLAHSEVPKVLGVVFFDTLSYGCLIVGITAVATAHHFAGAAGALIAVLSAGVVISGLVYGAHPWNAHHRTILAVLYAAGGLLFASGAYVSDLVLLGAVLLVLGSIGGPRDTLVQFVLGDAAPPEERTEAFAWLSTVTWVGYGLGTSLAGQLNGVGSSQAGATFLAGAAASFVSAAFCLTFRRKASAPGIPYEANAPST